MNVKKQTQEDHSDIYRSVPKMKFLKSLMNCWNL